MKSRSSPFMGRVMWLTLANWDTARIKAGRDRLVMPGFVPSDNSFSKPRLKLAVQGQGVGPAAEMAEEVIFILIRC
jgi:hypothetical protein